MIYMLFTGINYNKLIVEKNRDSIYMLFTGINYNKLIVEKNRDSIFTTDYEHMETWL
jgi:hypothetical protein